MGPVRGHRRVEVVNETAWSTLDPQNQEAHASPASARYLDRSAAQGEMSKRPDLERVRATIRGSNLGMPCISRSWDYLKATRCCLGTRVREADVSLLGQSLVSVSSGLVRQSEWEATDLKRVACIE